MVYVAVSLAEIYLLTENWDSYKLISLHHHSSILWAKQVYMAN